MEDNKRVTHVFTPLKTKHLTKLLSMWPQAVRVTLSCVISHALVILSSVTVWIMCKILLQQIRRQMLPVSSLLTVIITTSPTPSKDSTILISSILDSFRLHCPDLAATRVIVVFDTFDRVTARQRLKSGSASPEIAQTYDTYKDNVKSLVLCEYVRNEAIQDVKDDLDQLSGLAEFGSPFDDSNVVELAISQTKNKWVTFIEPVARLGFALAVRSALRMVETPYVWVQQHDWALVADIPLRPLLEVMMMQTTQTAEEAGVETDPHAHSTSKPIKYVSFISGRILRYAQSQFAVEYPALRAFTAALKQTFTPTSQPDAEIPLTPLFFWFDKPHLASTAHYLSRVFPSRLAVRRGDFIEDKIGQRARTQMKDGLWHKWACWLYYPREGEEVCLRHLMGRTWKGTDGDLMRKYRSWAEP